MNEIICPHCKRVFSLDEAGFADILKQVRDHQFEEELNNRLMLLEKEKVNAIKLAEANVKNALQKELAQKEQELTSLKVQSEAEFMEKLAEKERAISQMRSTIEKAETEKQLAVSEAMKSIEKERDDLANNLREKEISMANAVKLAEAHVRNVFQEKLAQKEQELTSLKVQNEAKLMEKLAEKEHAMAEMKSKIERAETEKLLAVSEATKRMEKERDDLVNDLKIKETEKALLAKSIEEQYSHKLMTKEETIRLKDDEIARLKDFKQKLSTKMLGETLEQHCQIEFDKLRPTAFQKAYFEKDNDASGGTKGDFIYREADDEGNEIISIMFEMKNENEETVIKKKNEDFFAKLDKDRRVKKCEYAVLVSLLEAENDLYNSGIVDVSYRFEKMYVVRPQFFIPIITLLRNAAMNSLKYKQELNLARNQHIDITNFEDKITRFKEGFAKNYRSASLHFEKAIEEIDKSIARMQKVKQELTTSANQLRLANQKAEGLTIKRLTYGNPTMKAKFDDAGRNRR
ncbi:MAG: hypothetical protein CSA95_07985 [Bacteroidetes bacterium]|nr:MAG: hypothetical protein CSA95_07985 [Bacteroidota bacterium]PIE88225.1 MAG: hypothetical protein CSA04_03025 [Bacteroidota bacterium]